MVVFAITLQQLGMEIGADIGEEGSQSVDGIRIEYFASEFCNKDQVDVHFENAVSAVSNFVFKAQTPR